LAVGKNGAMNWTGDNKNMLEDQQASDLTGSYSALQGVYDEMMDPATGVRPHWQGFLQDLGALDPTEIRNRWDTAQRLVRENGTTYNVYDESGEGAHPWRMDPIPSLINANEWRHLEAGLIQRAHLLNAIVADLYGPQTLLTEGRMPSSLVFGSPHFLRALHGIQMPTNGWLNFIAVDLARPSANKCWV